MGERADFSDADDTRVAEQLGYILERFDQDIMGPEQPIITEYDLDWLNEARKRLEAQDNGD